ncbi:uncharacterized protein K460DRAFT_209482 [Cucurbitaria berberidis CBS 394.84]|uniref:C3H1-type domain-containing protein n=1 Tax=Cucurbitaria berberidis CBS 394.84 TaxID=1168544 RepID=A0A9P4G7J4_9PLEO|nr:uncharacterized protein K460DRAFT_209482 [Cucurbitaria berberidis CBS 394.84]KAF1840496.1 hypothetical protein K460DRAFT_209482 [Cucurbitaria berberidis CBS 394.84]
MAPPGPPPYTLEQILAMTSPEEQIRARAELKSYIARMKKEKEDRLAYEAYQSDGYSNYGHSGGASETGYSNSYRPVTGPKRGGYAHGGNGYNLYHPYQRSQPPHIAQKFKNRSVTFTKSDVVIESSGANEAGTLSPKAANNTIASQSSQQQIEPKTLCPAFTSTGVCSRHGCRHLHDPNQQALCKRWLYKDECLKGEFCPLSHKTSPHNSPTCLHFQEGRCKNDNCRFAHVRINPAANNCEAFGRLGYCVNGNACPNLHAHECPFFSNTGVCPFFDKCRLGHVHRASRMRKANRSSSADRASLSGTPEEEDLDTAEDTQEWTIQPKTGSIHNPHQFTQQADFVPLDADD